MNGVAWGATTDRGRVRTVNEDSMLAELPLFVVADGMGGHAAGDVASRLAIDAFSDLVGDQPIGVQDVIDAVAAANRTIVDEATADERRSGMGTTVAGLALVSAGGEEHWMVFNIGDSRVYRLADGELVQLTVDHSEAEELVAAGRITREEARSYERRNVVTRSLGSDPPEMVDSWVFPPVDGERFLVCSDGLTGEVTDDVIGDCLLSTADPQRAAELLLHRAIEAGGSDNVTVLVVDGQRGTLAAIDEDTMPRKLHVG